MSACEQCCRLCNNSIPLKVYNEKFRDATYISLQICCNCVNFCTLCRIYGKQCPYHNYIHRIQGHNPGCSSTHGICWSDPFAGYHRDSCLSHIFVAVNISLSSNSAMHVLSVVPCRVNYKSTSCIHAHMNWYTLGFFRNRMLFHPHRFVVARYIDT